jgi:hypothetical protein
MNNLVIRGYRKLGRILRIPAEKPDKLPLPELSVHFIGRTLYYSRLFDMIRDLPGDVVECGVGIGHTLLIWTGLCYYEGRQRHMWGFDSFEGFPEPTAEDASPRNPQKGEWNVATLKTINEKLLAAGFGPDWIRAQVTLVKGFFEESLPKYAGDRIALLHIDADLYQSYMTVFNELYDRVVPGGVIALDEYMSTFEHYHYPGAQKAIDEFFADKKVKIIRDDAFGKYYLIKPKK